MTNGYIVKITKMWRNNLGVMMILGELFLLHDVRLQAVPNAVFWSYYTKNGVEEHYHEHNLVELREVKRLRRLLMITAESLGAGRIQQQMPYTFSDHPPLVCERKHLTLDSLVPVRVQQQTPNTFSDPRPLICGWKYIALGAANGESMEEAFRPLTASEADTALARPNCDLSQYELMVGSF